MSKSFFARDKCRSVVGKVSVKEDGHSEGWEREEENGGGGEEKRGQGKTGGRGGMRETQCFFMFHVFTFERL